MLDFRETAVKKKGIRFGASIAFSIVIVFALFGLNTVALWLVRSQSNVHDAFWITTMVPHPVSATPSGELTSLVDPHLRLADSATRHSPADDVKIVVD